MHRRHKRTLAAVALQLFAALALAATVADSHAPGASGASALAPASFGSKKSNPSGVQRRRVRPRRDALLPGVWGGQHIRFEVTEGGAAIEYDCARGTVKGRILVDRAGRFSVAGTYYREHGGPVREGEGSTGQPVRFNGLIGGSLMKLTVTRGRTRLGTYTLTRDSEGRVFKCR